MSWGLLALLQTFPCLILLICDVRVIFSVTEMRKLIQFSVLAQKGGDGENGGEWAQGKGEGAQAVR